MTGRFDRVKADDGVSQATPGLLWFRSHADETNLSFYCLIDCRYGKKLTANSRRDSVNLTLRPWTMTFGDVASSVDAAST